MQRRPLSVESKPHYCPRCGSGTVERLPRRGVLGHVLPLVGLRLYRCRECWRRFPDRPSTYGMTA